MVEEVKDKINQILISGNIENNMEIILENIPEISNMIGFSHNNPQHHLDVWNHTLEAMRNLENFDDLEIDMAILLHDIGKPFSYQENEVRHFKGHQEVSYNMSKTILTRLGYDNNFINNVCYLVKTHDTKINPSHLDNDYDMIVKRLKIQYADAKAHHPSKVEKRIKFLDDVKEKLEKINSKKDNI